jgi:hypothetical protein
MTKGDAHILATANTSLNNIILNDFRRLQLELVRSYPISDELSELISSEAVNKTGTTDVTQLIQMFELMYYSKIYQLLGRELNRSTQTKN